MDSLMLGLRVLVSLAAVLGLMWFLHRRLRRAGVPRQAKAMTVVSRQGVGPKASVVLIETEGTRFLLGVTEHGINVLHTAEAAIPEAVIPAAVIPEALAPETLAAEMEAPTSLATPLATRRAARRAASFDRELRSELGRAGLGSASSQPLAGSILDADTWRQAAVALRAGRRR